MYPAKQTELLLEIAALQRKHESNETDGIEREANEAMVCRKTRELCIREDNMLWNSVS